MGQLRCPRDGRPGTGRNQRLITALSDCVDGTLFGQSSVSDRLAAYPHLRSDLDPLLQTAQELIASRRIVHRAAEEAEVEAMKMHLLGCSLFTASEKGV